MAFPITTRAENESKKLRLEPQLVLEIEGVDTLFGAVTILRFIRIGDPDLFIGDDWRIGGLRPADDQEEIISFEAGTTTKIAQQLRPDLGSVASISSVTMGLIDKNEIASRLISPGVVVPDILGRTAKVWMGLRQTSFKEDYVRIFEGIIDDVQAGAGMVTLNIAHPDQKKRQDIFIPVDVTLDGAIDNSQVTIPLTDASSVPTPQPGPDGSFDPTIKFYIRFEDEIVRYTGVAGNNLTGCSRGQLGSLAVSHTPSSDPIPGKTATLIESTAVDIALKTMLSGLNDFWATDIPITRFLHPDPSMTVPNSIYFEDVDLNRDYGLSEGDFITIAGSVMGANNVNAKRVQEIVVTESGSYAVIADVSFVEDTDTLATVSFRSQYDTWGYGLGLKPSQVDVDEHIFWNNFQLASSQYRFYLDDKINGKDFLDKQVYFPVGAYSLPRQGRCSMGYTIGPVIGETPKILNRDNIKNPQKIRIRRTTNQNFYNAIVYKFDKLPLSGKYVSGAIQAAAESLNRIPIGFKPLSITADGMRSDLDGLGQAARISARFLGRYKLGAEFIESIEVLFHDGYPMEPGDNIILDPTGLKMTNTADGTRVKPPKAFTILNKTLDLKTGGVILFLLDSNFDGTERYGVVSPSSLIVSGTTTELEIQDSFGILYPGNESKKWADYVGLPIIVHSADWSFEEVVRLLAIDSGDRYKLILDPATPLSVPPTTGYIIDIANYPDTTNPKDDALYKSAHVSLSKTATIVSGADNTHFDVAPGDEVFFTVGGAVRVHDVEFTDDSGELTVASIVGQTIETNQTMGFTPAAGYQAENMPFKDGGKTYRIF